MLADLHGRNGKMVHPVAVIVVQCPSNNCLSWQQHLGWVAARPHKTICRPSSVVAAIHLRT